LAPTSGVSLLVKRKILLTSNKIEDFYKKNKNSDYEKNIIINNFG